MLSIDFSGPALAGVRIDLVMNPQLDASRAEWQEADVFDALRVFRKEDRQFDLIVLDPPKFVLSATRAYKDINLLGFRLLRPGGYLLTYSCSGGIGLELFQNIIAGAAVDTVCDAHILQSLSTGSDHPVALDFPEGEYLKGLRCRWIEARGRHGLSLNRKVRPQGFVTCNTVACDKALWFNLSHARLLEDRQRQFQHVAGAP